MTEADLERAARRERATAHGRSLPGRSAAAELVSRFGPQRDERGAECRLARAAAVPISALDAIVNRCAGGA